MHPRDDAGSASVEHAGLTALIALLFVGLVAALASGPLDGARELGTALARKARCAAVGPEPCWRDPLTQAYGRSVAGAVRALAPQPATATAPSGARLLPVDFRRCRSESCALPGERHGLTASNRRVTAFVSVVDRRRADGHLEISFWLYRPTMAWERVVRTASGDAVERLAPTPLLDSDVPALVSLETLPGANHFRFAPVEEPPWRWRIGRR